MPTTFTLIGSTTIGSGGVTTLTFSSIPTTYNDLMLYSNARVSQSGRTDGQAIMNSVTSGYRFFFVEGYATNTVYTSVSNGTSQQDILMNQSDHTTNYFSTSQIYISNYKSTGIKPTSSYQCSPSNSSANFYIQTATSVFPSGAAINSLTISPKGGSIVQFSSFHLYGISYT
jgi:hypothetical protein